ncbi:MAG TPA: ankyrin repeat domain-containing protein [Lachnospiraceae bacterium]|nr:ankyrin repeat domain-containing protein [Lachnospiraceae bacterium]
MDYRNYILEGNLIELDKLVQNGWDMNLSNADELGYTPLIEAIGNRNGSMEVIQYLVEHGANLEKGDSREGTPLLHACIAADSEVLNYLISKGANVNCLDDEGLSPLHYICRYAFEWDSQSIIPLINAVNGETKNSSIDDYLQIVKILLENHAVLNVQSHNGLTPIHMAASHNGEIFIPLLVEAGADVNIANANQYTPLHSAADTGNAKATRDLLNLGANVNAKDVYGFTPLIGAVLSGNRTVVNWLKSYGADRTVQVLSAYNIVAVGDTALDVARKMSRQDLVDALLDI